MKSKFAVFAMIGMLVFFFSCGKDDIEKGIDCVGQSFFIKLTHTADASNSKKINYAIEYTGSYTLKSVKWTFGDGTTETVAGTSTSHTYTAAGTYTVKADVTVENGSSSCTSSPTKSVVVE